MLETKRKNNPLEPFELSTRKRKREIVCTAVKDNLASTSPAQTAAGFTNAAFSSTPKRVLGRRRTALPVAAKENTNPFEINPCLEVKSIADIAMQKEVVPSVNPYEVIRKPPKKKLREEACFENPALNLDFPEKQFNPFEIVRQTEAPTQCFVNQALNVLSNDAPAVVNPYEIQRQVEPISVKLDAGVGNPALSEETAPTNLKIGLPFTPCVGYRIEFNGLPLAQLTPTKLLAEKLVFSPIPQAKHSLDAIIEEPPMDIGKELDLYQLELENSINEAKLRKHAFEVVEKVEVQQRITCTRTLTEISEVDEEEEEEQKETELQPVQPTDVNDEVSSKADTLSLKESNLELVQDTPKETTCNADTPKADVAYASDSEEEYDLGAFKAPPSRFVRAFRPASPIAIDNKVNIGSKESLHSIKSNKSNKSEECKPSASMKMGSLIRKSIRKIMHPTENVSKKPELPIAIETKQHQNIISSIRHSLRRKPQKAATTDIDEEGMTAHPAEISIIDSSERIMKFKSSIPQTEYMTIEQLTNEKKHTLRNSIRRSTKEVMRHVFHKNHEAYITRK